jgi:predicted DNA-binding ribbon-helix-helix protein
MARPVKRSLTLRGHRTSVSLEDEFWGAFRAIATRDAMPINVLAAQIDAHRGTDCGLASAIRLFVLRDYQNQAGQNQAGQMPANQTPTD